MRDLEPESAIEEELRDNFLHALQIFVVESKFFERLVSRVSLSAATHKQGAEAGDDEGR